MPLRGAAAGPHREREKRALGDRLGERRRAPRGKNRIGKLGHGRGKPRGGPLLERRRDQVAAPEMQRRLHCFNRERGAGFDRGAPFVQLRQLPLGGEEDRADRAAGGTRLGDVRFKLGRAASKGGTRNLRMECSKKCSLPVSSYDGPQGPRVSMLTAAGTF